MLEQGVSGRHRVLHNMAFACSELTASLKSLPFSAFHSAGSGSPLQKVRWLLTGRCGTSELSFLTHLSVSVVISQQVAIELSVCQALGYSLRFLFSVYLFCFIFKSDLNAPGC